MPHEEAATREALKRAQRVDRWIEVSPHRHDDDRGVGDIAGANVNVRSAFTFTFAFTSAFLALNAAANARERESVHEHTRAPRARRALID